MIAPDAQAEVRSADTLTAIVDVNRLRSARDRVAAGDQGFDDALRALRAAIVKESADVA